MKLEILATKTYALSIPVLDGGEHPHSTVVKRQHLRAVGSPHEVRSLREDRIVVGSGFSLSPTVRG